MKIWPLVLANVAFLAAIAVYYFQVGGPQFVLVSDWLAVGYAFVAILVGLFSLHGKQKTKYYLPLLLILFGIVLWFAAELIWVLVSQSAYVVVESMRLSGYLPLLAGFYFILRSTNPKFMQQGRYVHFFLGAFAMFSIVYVVILPLISNPDSVFKSIAVNGYVVADIALLFGAFLLIYSSYKYRGTFLSLIWVSFALAFLAVFSFDIIFTTFWQHYYFGHPYEILVLANYILVALGFYFYHAYCKENKESEMA